MNMYNVTMSHVSVVIPAWNEEKYLHDALDAIDKQTVRPVEVIVVDNNSVDNTAKIAAKRGAKVIKESVQGITAARNAGFNAAQGTIIARTDADTHVPPNWIETIVNVFGQDNSIVGVSGPTTFFDLQSDKTSHKGSTFFAETYVTLARLIHGHEVLIGPNMGVRKSAWEKIKTQVNLNDALVHEDIDLAYNLSKVGIVTFDKELVVEISSRRIKYNPKSFFVDYVMKHKPGLVRHLKSL